MFVQGVGDVLHGDVGCVTLHLKVIDSSDVGVVKSGGEPGLPLECFQILWVICDRLVNDLDGYDTV